MILILHQTKIFMKFFRTIFKLLAYYLLALGVMPFKKMFLKMCIYFCEISMTSLGLRKKIPMHFFQQLLNTDIIGGTENHGIFF